MYVHYFASFHVEKLSNLLLILVSQQSPSFWVMAQAVKQFTENEGKGALPLRGSIPDMFADSKRYIQLQNV